MEQEEGRVREMFTGKARKKNGNGILMNREKEIRVQNFL
jgi:hypothetical protein